jgi:nitroreductase
MDFTDVIRRRESVRNYDPDRPVDKDTLERILEAGRIAPSAVNRQPWRFLLVSSKPILLKLRECYGKPWFHDAPHVLVVAGRRAEAFKRRDGTSSLEVDLTIAMDHMILAAENEGVGTCWIMAFDPKALKNALELAEDELVLCITPLGYPRQGWERKKEKPRKPLTEIVRYL